MSDVKPCCLDESNRRITAKSVRDTPDGPVTSQIEACSVCGQTHYRMIVPPVHVNVSPARIT